MGIWEILLLAVAGILGGSINAIAGGGSLVTFPALMAAGMPPLQANVTNSVGQWPGYVGGVVGFRKELRPQQHRLRQVIVAAAIGSITGTVLLLSLPPGAFDAVVPVLVLVAAVLTFFQPRLKEYAIARQAARSGPQWELPVAVGVVTAYGGYFLGGLGVILLGVLAAVSPDTLRRNNALKSAISLVTATVALVTYSLFAPVNWAAVAITAPAALVGGLLGARLATRISETLLRWVVIVLSLGVSIWLFVQLFT
ncbi:MAG: sulfite exporter TauE/SafE family protein [Cumulibacter sp.]